MPQVADAISETGEGAILTLEVTPGSRSDAFPAGFNPWRKTIICRVTAPPIEGRANAAVLSLVAATLGVPGSSVRLVSGPASSIKRVLVRGFTKTGVLKQISSLME